MYYKRNSWWILYINWYPEHHNQVEWLKVKRGHCVMIIGTAKIHMRANWVHSLKEKRFIVKSIIDKVRNKYNVSISEVEHQDIHQSIVIGIACISNDKRHADSILQNVVNYIESNCEASIENIIFEVL